MSLYTFDNCTVTIAADGLAGTISGDVSAFSVTPGMTMSIGSSGGESGSNRIITAWTPNGTSGAAFSVKAAFGAAYDTAKFVVNTGPYSGSLSVAALAALTRITNYLASLLGSAANLDGTSQVWTALRGVGEATRSTFQHRIGTPASSFLAAQWVQLRRNAKDYWVAQVSPDGTTVRDAIVLDNATGGVDFLSAEAAVASAATCDIGAVPSRKVQITGTAAITSFGASANKERLIRFAGAMTLTHNGTSLILPDGTTIVTAVGDTAYATSDADGNWTVRQYSARNAALAIDVAIQRARLQNALSVSLFGDSLVYGVIGAGQATHTLAAQMQAALRAIYPSGGSSITVANDGVGGNTISDGLARLKAKASGFANVVFVCFGTNDAAVALDIAVYRRDYEAFIRTAQGLGASVVVMLSPMCQYAENSRSIAAYNMTALELARKHRLRVVDYELQLRRMVGRYSDEPYHMTDEAYGSVGWDLAAILAPSVGLNGPRQIGANERWHADELVAFGYGGMSMRVWSGSTNTDVKDAANGRVLVVPSNLPLVIWGEFVDEVVPVVTLYNPDAGTERGGTFSHNNFAVGDQPSVYASHKGELSLRRQIVLPRVQRGHRVPITFAPAGTAYVEAIEFCSPGARTLTSQTGTWRQGGLTGAMIPANPNGDAGAWATTTDYSQRLTAPFEVECDVTLPSGAGCGLSFAQTTGQNLTYADDFNRILVGRAADDTSAIISFFGVSPSIPDVTVASKFTAGADWRGKLRFQHTKTQVKMYLNGTLVATATPSTMPFVQGYMGISEMGDCPRLCVHGDFRRH